MRTADSLVDAIMMDEWPSLSALVDFGLDRAGGEAQRRYEAYYYPVRNGEITADMLYEAATSGPSGERLTALVRNAPSNPHKDVTITTIYDKMEDTD